MLRYQRYTVKMDSQLKDQLMKQFVNNEIQILVSTTVIEVGLDNPNATMMIIYDAQQFGLSQLHQLRGRVGRGSDQSYCYLLSNSKDPEVKEKLHFLEAHADGFEVARFDLKEAWSWRCTWCTSIWTSKL